MISRKVIMLHVFIIIEINKMAETLQKRIGRTSHDIHLLAQMGLMPLSPGQTMFPVGSEEESGFMAQRLTFYKDVIRRIFRTDKTSTTYAVGKRPFAIQMPQSQFHVMGGIVTNIGLAAFPYNTVLTIYNLNGTIYRQYPYAGNPEIQ